MKFFQDLKTGATIALGFSLTLGMTVLLAQSLNEFSGGQLISAASINANFANLKSRLDKPLTIQTADIATTDMQWVGSTLTDVPGLSLTVTTNGSPIWVGLTTTPGNNGYLQITGASPGCETRLAILRDTTLIYTSLPRFTQGDAIQASVHYPLSAFWAIDSPGAGTYTYKVQVADLGTDCDDIIFAAPRLFAIRLHES